MSKSTNTIKLYRWNIAPATGKRKREIQTFERVKDGKEWVAEMKLKLKKGILVEPRNITFREFCKKVH